MSKKNFRRIIAATAICTLAFPLAACSSDEELTLEICQEKQQNSSFKDPEERQKCDALIEAENEKQEKEREEQARKAEEEARKAEEERLAKEQEIKDNVIMENYKAEFTGGVYLISMDITNKNDVDVANVTVTIPYGERYKDNYGDTQAEPKEYTRTIDILPAKTSQAVKIYVGEDYAKEKMTPIDEKEITVTTDGEAVDGSTQNEENLASQFDVKYSPDGNGFNVTVTNNTGRKVDSVTFQGIKVKFDGKYDCTSSSANCDPTGSLSVQYLKPGATSEAKFTHRKLIDIQVTDIQYGD